jgi:hypothetical protein
MPQPRQATSAAVKRVRRGRRVRPRRSHAQGRAAGFAESELVVRLACSPEEPPQVCGRRLRRSRQPQDCSPRADSSCRGVGLSRTGSPAAARCLQCASLSVALRRRRGKAMWPRLRSHDTHVDTQIPMWRCAGGAGRRCGRGCGRRRAHGSSRPAAAAACRGRGGLCAGKRARKPTRAGGRTALVRRLPAAASARTRRAVPTPPHASILTPAIIATSCSGLASAASALSLTSAKRCRPLIAAPRSRSPPQVRGSAPLPYAAPPCLWLRTPLEGPGVLPISSPPPTSPTAESSASYDPCAAAFAAHTADLRASYGEVRRSQLPTTVRPPSSSCSSMLVLVALEARKAASRGVSVCAAAADAGGPAAGLRGRRRRRRQRSLAAV